MLLGSIGLATTLGFESMPATDNGQVSVNANFDSGITLDTASQKTKQLEDVISKYPEVKFMYSTVKKSNTAIKIQLVDKKQRKESSSQITDKLRNDLVGISGAQITVSSSGGPGSTAKDVAYNLVGDDRAAIQAFADKMVGEMSKDPNARDVGTNSKAGTPQVRVEVDRDKAADLGVNSSDVASMLSTLYNGSNVTKYDGGKDRYDVKVSIDDNQRKNLDDLDNIYVLGTKNQQVPLSQVTKKVIETTSSSLYRFGKQPQIELSANVTGGILSGTLESKYKAKIQSELPEGISLSVGGTSGQMAEGLNSMIQAIFISILFLYFVMAAQFESFVDPISIMFALPLALIGAVLGLFVFGSSISMICMIGVIMLMGLVAKNGILLIDAAKEKIAEGVPRNEAIRQAGYLRLRPIIMTSLAMIFGMIPAALASGSGSESRAPMAQAIIGGLITSSILTLFVVPIVYTILDDWKNKFNKTVHKKSVKVEEEINSSL